jgi:hypothetical protein
MRDDQRGVSIDPDARAVRTPTKAAAIAWPLPVDRRLDQLVERANDVGARTSRAELAAAIIAQTPPDSDSLLAAVLRWRTATVRSVVLDVAMHDDVVYLPRYRPGRRSGGG